MRQCLIVTELKSPTKTSLAKPGEASFVLDLDDAPPEFVSDLLQYCSGFLMRFAKGGLAKALKDKELSGSESLADAFKIGHEVIMSLKTDDATLAPENLEAVVLERTVESNRKMRRLTTHELGALIPSP